MSKALIIVDPQNDFCEGGSLGVKDSNNIFPVINRLREEKNFHHVFITLDWHPQNHLSFAKNHSDTNSVEKVINDVVFQLWPVHCVNGTKGAEPSKLLVINEKDIFVQKGLKFDEEQYSGFGTPRNPTELEARLRELNVKKVCVVGLALDYCVGSTALDAKKAGFEVTVIAEGTKSVTQTSGIEMIKKLKEQKISYLKLEDYFC